MFVWDEDDLNAEQVAAVEEPGSVFLTACPGSGKTRTLTYRIARELSLVTSARQRVVAITYTHRAAEEIQDRIDRLGVDSSRLWIGTIHAFCLEWILKPYGLYHPALRNGFKVIDPQARDELLDALCAARGVRGFSRWECEHYVTTTSIMYPRSEPWLEDHVDAVMKAYHARLKAERQIDFELMLKFAFQLVSRGAAIAKILSRIFTCILVDEYQDTKEIQYGILAAILKAGAGTTRAFIVGDPNQAILASLGGHAMTADMFGGLSGLAFAKKELSRNYRSSRRIVEYFGNFNELTTTIEAAGEHKEFPSLITFDTTTHRNDLEAELVRLIRHSIEVEKIPAREVCVVAPQWVPLASMTRSLLAALPEYEFNGPGSIPFARNPDNFWYKVSRIVLTEPHPALFVRRLRWAGEVLRELVDAGAPVDHLTRRDFLKLCNGVRIDENDGLTYLRLFFDALLATLALALDDYPGLKGHHAAFFQTSALRLGLVVKEGGSVLAELAAFRRAFSERSGITVSSIHSVKGLEFDTVIAYCLLEEMVPHHKDTDGQRSATKLLYVIGSRARKHLHLISEQGRQTKFKTPYLPTKRLLACAYTYSDWPSLGGRAGGL
jgi:DNA helicase-2/ATP-dependent DNA helicase PcrA